MRNQRHSTLNTLLNEAWDEKPMQAFFSEFPEVFVNTFRATQRGRLVSQFRMGGGKYIPDFVMAHGFSGGWNITLVELESPNAPLFTQDGTQSKHLRVADRQINDWKRFVEQNKASFLRDLSLAIRDRDLNSIGAGRSEEPTDSASWKLTNPDSLIIDEYVIVIGRSSRLSYDDVVRKAHTNRASYEIITYDRFWLPQKLAMTNTGST